MQNAPPIRIGTRQSKLALAQAEIVRALLQVAFPMRSFELVPMLTTGDRNTDTLIADIGGKRLFTKELEEGLLQNRIDLAVHSLKDMETLLPAGLVIGAVIERDDPRDALVARDNHTLASLPLGARIGTSSPRRAAQLAIVRPDLEIIPFRGNVPTRVNKLKAGEVDATLLAVAGLRRLGMENEVTEILDTGRFIPAAGQGTIAVECREDNAEMREMLGFINHQTTHQATIAERSVLAAIGGSCRTPAAAYARVTGDRLVLNAMIAKLDHSDHVHVSREGQVGDAAALGQGAGQELLARGGKDWLS